MGELKASNLLTNQNAIRVRWLLWILSALGFIDSVYLFVLKMTNNPTLCIKGVGDCWSVNNSVYSEILGIPISALGALAYLAIVFLIVLERRGGFWKNYSAMMVFGISLAGWIYSLYLTYLEIFVLRSICPFCVVSAVLMTLIFVLSIVRLNIINPQS
jgi:uncharacterized membrane protein